MRIITFILLLLSTTLVAQEERAFHYGISGGLSRTFQSFESSQAERTESNLSNTVMINIFYDLDNKNQFQFGIGIENNQFNSKDYTPRFGCDAGSTNPETHSFITNLYNQNYMVLPLRYRRKLVGERDHLYAEGGANLKFKISDSSIHSIWECGENPADFSDFVEVNDFQASLEFAMGYEMKIANPVKIYLETNFSYGLNNYESYTASSDIGIEGKLYSIGLTLGSRF